MKKIVKSILATLSLIFVITSLNCVNASAAVDRHYAVKYTAKDYWYGVTANVTLPSTINGLGKGNAGYADWYIGLDPVSGTAVEAGISYKQGQFRVFLNTGNGNGAGIIDNSIKLGQTVNLKVRLSADGKTAYLYVNGVLRNTQSTVGKFTNGKGKPKVIIGVQDAGQASTSKSKISNIKLCANKSGSSYTDMTSSMGTYSVYNAGNTSNNPFTVYSKFPLEAKLNAQ